MRTKLLISSIFLALLVVFSVGAQTTDIALWTYEPLEGDAANPIANVGVGTSEIVGVMTGTGTATGMNPEGSGCGGQTTGTFAWAIGTANPGTTNEGSGAQWNVSTQGYNGIVFSFDQRWSNASTNTIRVQYSIDGESWVNFEMSEENTSYCLGSLNNGRFEANTTGDQFRRITVNFSAIPAVNDNPNFKVRVVAAHYQETGEFRRVTAPATIATGGTWRFDNVTVKGVPTTASGIFPGSESLTGFNYVMGEGPSEGQSYVLTASGLTGAGDITVESSANYEISLTQLTGYADLLSLPYADGVITGQPLNIYVRLKSDLSNACAYSGEIVHSGGGVDNKSVTLSGYVNATLYPELHSLATADFSFSAWSSASPCRTYPASMRFWRTNTNEQADSYVEPSGVYEGVYNATSASRIIGHDDDGVSFVVTGTEGNGFPLGAVVGLNAAGRKELAMSWNIYLVAQGEGEIPREFAIKPQYKTGTEGVWQDVPGDVEFNSSGKATGDAETFTSVALPANLGLQPELYLRWVYYAIQNEGRAGSRPNIRLSNVLVTSLPDTGTSVHNIGASKVYAFGSAIYIVAESQGQSVELYNALGQQIGSYLINEGKNVISIQEKGVVLVRTAGSTVKVIL